MKRSYTRIAVGLLLPLCILFVAFAYILMPRPALSQSGSTLTGFLWSDTIGWISASCADTSSCATSNYGFAVASDGSISGYGWSDNIGWVSANASDLAGCPVAPCTTKISGNKLTGWLKALLGSSPPSNSQNGGWDGWISLNGPNYGPVLGAGGVFSGFAWGSIVVGWVDASLVQTGFQPCTASYTCNGQTIVYTSPQCNPRNGPTCTLPANFCSPGSSTCIPTPPSFVPSGTLTGHLQVSPKLVRTGGRTQVYWNIDPATVQSGSCSVTSPNKSWSGPTSGALGQQSNPINQQTTFTLSCTALDGSPMTPETATVNIVPVFQEI